MVQLRFCSATMANSLSAPAACPPRTEKQLLAYTCATCALLAVLPAPHYMVCAECKQALKPRPSKYWEMHHLPEGHAYGQIPPREVLTVAASPVGGSTLVADRLVLLCDKRVRPWRTNLQAVWAGIAILTGKGIACEVRDVGGMTDEELEH